MDIRVLVLFAFHPLVLLSVTILGTTGLSTIANAVMVFMLYALSVMGGVLEQIGYYLRNDSLIDSGILTSLLMPADSLYRKMVHYLLPVRRAVWLRVSWDLSAAWASRACG